MVHYLASAIEIPEGTFGDKPFYVPLSEVNWKQRGIKPTRKKVNKYRKDTAKEFVRVFEKEEDMSGMCVHLLEGDHPVRKKFKNSYIYELTTTNTEALFAYIDKHLFEGGEMELFSCRAGKEAAPQRDDLMIECDLNQATITGLYLTIEMDKDRLYEECSRYFSFREGQFAVIKKCWSYK